MRHLLPFGICIIALALTGCGKTELPNKKPLVVASFFPLYDFARQIGGTDFEVQCLVPPGGDPHAMEATPGIAKLVSQADLVLLLGLGMDGWVEKLATSERKAKLTTVSEGMGTRKMGRAALAELVKDAPDPNETDPHVWLDPVNALQIVSRITAEMIKLAPQKQAQIQARSAALRAELERLNEDFKVSSDQFHSRKVVTFHGAFGYLFGRYKIEVAGVVEQFPGDEPSAAYLRGLVDLMRKLDLKIIFAEPQLPDRLARVIAEEIGGRVERLDPCETILPDAPKVTYLERQRKNLQTLKNALGLPSPKP